MATNKPIRLSPSGPILTGGPGPDGPPAIPGPGMQLRLAEAKATIGGAISQTLDELGNEALRVELDNINRELRYKAYCQINSAEFAALQMVIERSVDHGVTWQQVDVDTFVGVTAVYRMAVANKEMDVGSDEFGWDIPEGATSLMIRCMVGAGTNTYVGQIASSQGFIGLAELL